jgi:hypothetical protein
MYRNDYGHALFIARDHNIMVAYSEATIIFMVAREQARAATIMFLRCFFVFLFFIFYFFLFFFLFSLYVGNLSCRKPRPTEMKFGR